MSLNILKDNTLDIEVSLLKKVRVDDGVAIVSKISQIVPVDLSALVKLSIEDSLTQHGLRGNITINNKGKLLDKLNITSGTPDDLYIKFNIVDEDLRDSTVSQAQSKISFLAMVKNTTAASANIEDNIVEFEFEEAFIAEMKYTSWDTLLLNNPAFDDNADLDIIKLVDTFYERSLSEESNIDRITLPPREAPTSDVLDLASSFGIDQATVEDTIEKAPNYSEVPSIAIPYIDNQKVNANDDSKVFDVFRRLLKKTSVNFGSALSTASNYHLPIFRFVNTLRGDRRMQFKSLITDRHRQFLKALEEEHQDPSTLDYADVYLEKFNIGPFSQARGLVDRNTSWHNSIETHSIERPDLGTLREGPWGNHCLVGAQKKDLKDQDIGNVKIDYVLYADAMEIFLNNILDLKVGGVNLPFLKFETQPRIIEYKKGDYAKSAEVMTNEALYKLISSFVTVNEQLHFTVRGKAYREPGKFIIVDRGEPIEDKDKDASQRVMDILNQVWFVSSITHNIENGEYTTDFICNRFFGEKRTASVGIYAKVSREKAKSAESNVRNRIQGVQESLNELSS